MKEKTEKRKKQKLAPKTCNDCGETTTDYEVVDNAIYCYENNCIEEHKK